ncbi:hypothetical protein ACTFIW_003828 [Dictyostelium discoideum]
MKRILIDSVSEWFYEKNFDLTLSDIFLIDIFSNLAQGDEKSILLLKRALHYLPKRKTMNDTELKRKISENIKEFQNRVNSLKDSPDLYSRFRNFCILNSLNPANITLVVSMDCISVQE